MGFSIAKPTLRLSTKEEDRRLSPLKYLAVDSLVTGENSHPIPSTKHAWTGVYFFITAEWYFASHSCPHFSFLFPLHSGWNMNQECQWKWKHPTCNDFLPLCRCFLPSVSEVGGMVQWASASHVPLVHIGSVLQQELTSYQRALKETQTGRHLFIVYIRLLV